MNEPVKFPGGQTFQDVTSTPGECCAQCRFWYRVGAKHITDAQGQLMMIALCRRFPAQIFLTNVPVGGNPRVIDRRTGHSQHATIQQQPVPFQTMSASTDWCGEFKA